MNYRKKILILILSLVLISVLCFLIVKYSLICNNSISCENYFTYGLKPVFLMTPLFISASLLVVVIFSEHVFNVWKKMSIFLIPIMLFLIFITEAHGPCGMFLCEDRQSVVIISGYLYIIISILVTLSSDIYFKIKDKNKV